MTADYAQRQVPELLVLMKFITMVPSLDSFEYRVGRKGETMNCIATLLPTILVPSRERGDNQLHCDPAMDGASQALTANRLASHLDKAHRDEFGDDNNR